MKYYIIPIFIPHLGCIHQCVFCNQKKITGRQTPVTGKQVAAAIEERLVTINQKRRVEVAFYGGSFTALPESIQNELLEPASQALQQGKIHAIRLSTRPDCINEHIVANLRKHGVSIVELGVQSLDDNVLAKAGRGHNRQDVVDAVQVLKYADIACGLQLMPGLPGENWPSLIKTVREAINLSPKFIRIYPTIVIADTVLADMYVKGLYQPLSLNQAITRSAYIKLLFERQGIQVIRTGLQASEELDNKMNVLAGPYHPAFGELVDSYIFYLMVARFLEQHALTSGKTLIIHHHTQDSSKIRGQHNRCIAQLKQQYNLKEITLREEFLLQKGTILLEFMGVCYFFNKNMI